MIAALRLGLAAALVASSLVAADAPYIGKWKFNAAKSQLAGLTYSIESAPGGMMRFDLQGYALSLRKISDRSFELTTKVDGKAFFVDTFTVSADGKTLTDDGVPVNAKSEAVKLVYDKHHV